MVKVISNDGSKHPQSGLNRIMGSKNKDDNSKETIDVNSNDKPKYPLEKCKYEVTPDTTFTIEFGLFETEGRFVVVSKSQAFDNTAIELHWIKFRYWTFDEEVRWKEECTTFDATSRAFNINKHKLNEMKIRNLLLDWSFSAMSDRLKLFHVNKYLVDESYEVFTSMFPNIVNTIVNMMNNILEENG